MQIALSFSIQQEKAFLVALQFDTNIVLEAVAGAGKTTTIKEMCNRIKAAKPDLRVRFMAFNKSIADELKTRISADVAEVGTIHSFCLRAWSQVARAKVDEYGKAKAVCEQLDIPFHLSRFVEKLVAQAKNSGAGILYKFEDRAKLEELVSHYDIDMEIGDNPFKRGNAADVDKGIDFAIEALKLHVSLGYTVIDYADMVWLPLLHNVKFAQVDFLLADEAQDFNVLYRLAAKRMLAVGGHAVFVGDRNQAIYGFSGADSESLDNIKEEFGAVELPLTVSYRCPKAIIKEAQKYVSHIQAADNAPDGKVSKLEYHQIMAQGLTNDDAIICRKTAPLVELAFSLIRNKIPCHIEGKEIGTGLVNLVRKWKRCQTVEQLLNKLEEHREKQVAILMTKGRESAADVLNDRCETIKIIADSVSLDSPLSTLEDAIKAIFADDQKTVTLSTIHKSKGREWNRVFWLGSEKYQPSKFARQAWQQQQETNLFYVAATRAKQELIYVTAKPEDK